MSLATKSPNATPQSTVAQSASTARPPLPPGPMTLPHLRIGSVDIGFPAVQAALSGYSDMAMRVIARRLGASYTLNEVVLDQFVLVKSRKLKRFTRILDEEHPVAGQLMGSNPDEFGPAARELAAAGYDVIDINFGCPVKKVLGRCRGGFLLSTPDRALEIVSRVRDAVPAHIPVTVKMRRGLDDSQQSRDHFFTIFDGAFERGIAAATVHGRTVRQGYIGPSRWSFLRDLKAAYPQRVILGSGDLFTAADCLHMFRSAIRGSSLPYGRWLPARGCRRHRACSRSAT
jgi:tRNA-dihydrouridine synthase